MSRSRSGKRDTNAIASDPLLGLTALPPRPSVVLGITELGHELSDLVAIEDRRTFHPGAETRPVLSPSGRARIRLRDPMSSLRRFGSQTKAIPVFSHPSPIRSAAVCLRRKARKEVLHALGLKGKGRGGARKPRSKIKC